MHNENKYCKDIECIGQQGERALYQGVWGGLIYMYLQFTIVL